MASIHLGNSSKVERYKFYNTLVGLVKTLENKYTTVDLRNECCVTGKIAAVDGQMNLEMEDVVFYDSEGNSKPLATFYVQSRNIRNVHMPPEHDAMDLLKKQFAPMSRPQKKKPTFKTVRARRYNTETIAAAYGSKQKKE